MSLATDYLDVTKQLFRSYKKNGDAVIERLSEEDLHYAPNEASNSVAVLVKHLSGNMLSRFTDFLTTDGEKEGRNRDGEFIDTLKTKEDIAAAWEKGWACLFRALDGLTEEQLLHQQVTIRKEPHTIIAAVNRQLAHYAGHVGQMIYIAKLLKGRHWESLSIPVGQSEAWRRP